MSQRVSAFLVTCKSCDRALMTAAQIRDPEIAVLVEHLAHCAPGFRGDAALGDILAWLVVETATS